MDRCLYYSRTVTCKLPEKVVYKSVNGPKTMETNGRERETQTWRNSWQLWVAKMPETELETTVVSCVQISRLSHTETREKANARVVLAINWATTQSWKISFFFSRSCSYDNFRWITRDFTPFVTLSQVRFNFNVQSIVLSILIAIEIREEDISSLWNFLLCR